ncbi:MAG: energy transducer TonB [Pseudomonadota bacterium]
MATPGTFISTVGHSGLLVWLVIGWGLSSEPLEMTAMDVSVISGEEFDRMVSGSTPEPGDADPTAPTPPEITDAPPAVVTPEPPVEVAPPPAPVAPPESETPPPPPPPAAPQADVADELPAAPAPPPAPPPEPDVVVSEEATPPQAPTVASTITAPPPPDAQVDDVVREEVVPDNSAEAEVVQDEQEATAPEETTTEIVIEDLAPTTSVRPAARPSRPTPPVETASTQPEAPTEPATSEETPPQTNDDVNAALADAMAGAEAPAVPAGPPMTGAERDSFRVAVNRCWNVDPGSVAARVTVEVGFSLNRDGTVLNNAVELLSSDGDGSATDIAFQAARRAILRCQSGGYELPADKYDQWRNVVITFDPSGMRLR